MLGRSRTSDRDAAMRSIDRAMQHLLTSVAPTARICDFEPYGYDERQYCSPGFNLPVGCLMRTPHGTYPEYHTSDDNLDSLRPEQSRRGAEAADRSGRICWSSDRQCLNLSPKGEPQLGKRGLYRSTGGAGVDVRHMALLWVLNMSDGSHALIEIAERARIAVPYRSSRRRRDLERVGLLKTIGTPTESH